MTFLDGKDLEDYTAHLTSCLTEVATRSTKLPSATDLAFYRSIAPESFVDQLDGLSNSILSLNQRLIAVGNGDPPSSNPEERDGDTEVDLEEQWEKMEDVVDSLLEKAEICIDQSKGRENQGASASIITQSTPQIAHVSKVGYKVMHSSNIPRPQLSFPDRVDNSAAPFQRKITYKPNAMVPLSNGTPSAANSGDEEWDSHHQSLGIADHLVSLPHPYAYEIAHLEHPASLFTPQTPQPYLPFDETPAQWVDTLETLEHLTQKLKTQKEIAVDLEAHDMRSYQGFTCLIQISTREEDFILDALALRPHLHLLNQSFTDPSITKVLHGATMDIEWLQRDFGVYIVNLFDTYHATKVLSFPSHSLASLLLKYTGVNADKKYQLADWRIRPIPQEMLQYAQSDTHYLLYIFDHLRNELLAGPPDQEETQEGEDERDPTYWMRDVLKRSDRTSLRKYEKPVYDAAHGRDKGGWSKLLERWERPLDGAQMAVFKAVHAWRDQVARDEDESVRYVLPNHQLFSLAEKCPVDQAAVIACCIPTPPLVRMHASDLALLIQHADAEALAQLGRKRKAEGDVVREGVVDGTKSQRTITQHIRFGEDEETPASLSRLGGGMKKRYLPPPQAGPIQAPQATAEEIKSVEAEKSVFFGQTLEKTSSHAQKGEKGRIVQEILDDFKASSLGTEAMKRFLPPGAHFVEPWSKA